MKKGLIFGLLLMAIGCSQHDEIQKSVPVTSSDLTGNSVTYALQAGSYWDINGTVVLSEKKDGSTRIQIKLNNLGNDPDLHPVHLHLGDLTVEKANVAALLNPVNGKTGESNTDIKILADETPVSYNDLKLLNACIKVHLAASGEGQAIVLAGGNIGTAISSKANGRAAIGVCKSE